MYRQNDTRSLERYSSAVTLSDMEVFIFPELLYALVLANCMSPRLWNWNSDPWFAKNGTRSPARRVQRLKQFIMDHFAFNLDLDTWGLTTKETEIKRFCPFISGEVLSRCNALFGYEGDKYYFDSDIRKHFGLDKYTTNVIPYWKTETIEAMEAFKHKPGYPTGAGECVSLSTLYAAAAFVVIGLPLEDIFLMTTPLHSQNYLDIGSGILTNNRRIVTKTMWFNGTEISAKARRALENEQVTIVSHHTGFVHALYPEATIDPDVYKRFSGRLTTFLSTGDIDFEILANFLRQHSKLQCCFQISHTCCGNKPRYIEAEKVFAYEHSSKARVSDHTRNAILHEIEEDEFYTEPIAGRLLFSELEDFFKMTRVSLDEPETIEKLKHHLLHACYNVDQIIPDLNNFCRTVPRLPKAGEKRFVESVPVDLSGVQSAEEAQDKIAALRDKNETCDLALAAFRDLSRSPWKSFLKAALERNPVVVAAMNGHSLEECNKRLGALPNDSIYNEPYRLAQPDEVWNFGRGDGLEKAITMAAIARAREPDTQLVFDKQGDTVTVKCGEGKAFSYSNGKTVELPLEQDTDFSAAST
ncbi:MAG: hypothetical protein JXA18_13240 [Chitinispirillaceae bacterium]|nr:hypothetical protein [Chitinispirillaceae bacterium]